MIKKIAILFFVMIATGMSASERPNILWIYLEDVSGWFSCYGDKVIKTPHIDSLAEEGIRFNRFYTCGSMFSHAFRYNLGHDADHGWGTSAQ